MEPIPRPDVLDADHLLRRLGDADEATEASVRRLCSYADALWERLVRARAYLAQSIDDGVRPAGPDDDAGWERWEAIYADITRILAGPAGDSGYAAGEARLLAQAQRSTS